MTYYFVLYWLPDMPYTNLKEKWTYKIGIKQCSCISQECTEMDPGGAEVQKGVNFLKWLSSGKDDVTISQTHGSKQKQVYTFIN